MKYRWSQAPPQPALTTVLVKELQISSLLAQCLLNRGLSEPEPIGRFLDPRLKHLADPFLLPNMHLAVERLFRAREGKEKVVIFGDYDVDGVSSSALLIEAMTALGWESSCYLPHRMEEGYGLSQNAAENCLNKFPTTLLLAVDCGSTATATIHWLQQRGVDVIVLDHHQISQPPPLATALVNPQLNGDNASSFRELCSVGLAFKLVHALVKRGRERGEPIALNFDLRPFLDLVALGTIADLVPLTGENRILVRAGLERLNTTKRPGLLALKNVAQVSAPVGGYEVGFQLAPRLNAAGRLEHAAEALQLLLARDLAQAEPLAHSLDARNRERQNIERRMAEEVLGALRAKFNPQTDLVIVEGQLLWHVGVVGIVASRVLQEFYRPTIILGGEAEEWRGSGRSIEGFDLAAALCECGDLLLRHGGHAMAAGLSLRPENLDGFRARINQHARRTLKPEQLQPALRLDAEVGPSELTFERVVELEKLQQTGIGNPSVQLWIRGITHQRPLQRIGVEKKHVKLWLTDGKATHEAVWWGAGDGALPTGQFDIAFTPRLNEFNGTVSVQLSVLDWRPAE